MRILLLEDDPSTRESLALYFTKAGHTVFPAGETGEARRLLGLEPDIILADIGLPGKSGIDFCRTILGFKRIPLLFLTARDGEEDILLGYEAGCQEYVTKPVSPRVLLKKMEVILNRGQGLGEILEYQGLRIDLESR